MTDAQKRPKGKPLTDEERINTLDPLRLLRAEQLFTGTGPEGAPLSTREIERTLAAEYHISPRMARRYLTAIRGKYRRLAQTVDTDALIEQTDVMLLKAFKKAHDTDDAAGMVNAATRRAELRGAFTRTMNVNAKFSGLAEALSSVMSEVDAEEASNNGTEKCGDAKEPA